MDFNKISDFIIEKAKKMNVKDVEIFIQRYKNFNVEVSMGKIEDLSQAISRGAGIRFFKNGKVSFVSTSDFNDKSINKSVQKGIELLETKTSEKANMLPDNFYSHSFDKNKYYDSQIEEITVEDKIDFAKEMEDAAFSYDSRIKYTEASSFSDTSVETYLYNSKGLNVNWRETIFSMYVAPVAEEKGNKQAAVYGMSKRLFKDLDDKNKISETASKKSLMLIGGEKIKTGVYPAVFDPDIGSVILSGIADGINGESVFRDRSFLANYIGKQIASERVNIIDEPHLERGLGSAFLDSEGIETRKKDIIKDGILRNFIYNTYTANKADKKSTGNAQRSSYEDTPSIGIFNFYMKNGVRKKEDIIGEVAHGLYVMDIVGGGVNPITGDFSSGVSGVLIENGKLTRPVAKVTIALKLIDLLKEIDAVADDLEFRSLLSCPTFRVGKIVISGT